MEIFKIFKFDAAHRLPNVEPGHKCSKIHGHSYTVEIHLRGLVDPQSGWLIDFDDIEKAFKPLHDQLDHKYLNNIDGLDNPTSENVAKWIWKNIHSALPQINKVILRESPESGCIYQGEE